jgi:4-amino-4-deoxy-L-arabinose transferase-like glycosyltransferase
MKSHWEPVDFQIRRLGDWMNLCLVVSLYLGFAFGLCTLVLSLAGGSAHSTVIVFRLTGPVAGLVNLIWCPILAGFFSIPLSLISYWPFRAFTAAIHRWARNR